MARKLYVKAAKYIVPVVKESGKPQNTGKVEFIAPNGIRMVVDCNPKPTA